MLFSPRFMDIPESLRSWGRGEVRVGRTAHISPSVRYIVTFTFCCCRRSCERWVDVGCFCGVSDPRMYST